MSLEERAEMKCVNEEAFYSGLRLAAVLPVVGGGALGQEMGKKDDRWDGGANSH